MKGKLEITKKDIEKLIELEKEDTFLNHLWNIFSSDFRPKGEIGRNEIKVWKQNTWISTFYPIFTFELNANNHLTSITNKLNPVGKTIIGIFLIGLLYLVFPKNPIEFDYLDNWPVIASISVFVLILILVARMIYSFEKRNQLEEIFEFLEIEVEHPKPKKEWSLKKIITRLLLYPFCIGLILFAIFYLFPKGKIILGIISLGIAGMYLFSDLKILIGKKTTGNNV